MLKVFDCILFVLFNWNLNEIEKSKISFNIFNIPNVRPLLLIILSKVVNDICYYLKVYKLRH